MKKYDEDLNITLIFVGSLYSPGLRMFTRVTGRSVLRHRLCFHP